jgi:hypothetical protein
LCENSGRWWQQFFQGCLYYSQISVVTAYLDSLLSMQKQYYVVMSTITKPVEIQLSHQYFCKTQTVTHPWPVMYMYFYTTQQNRCIRVNALQL